MPRLTRVSIAKDYLGFAAAHFTIFSAAERERLHGHSFRLAAEVLAPVGDDGLCFDYNELKKVLRALCTELDEYTLLPQHSAHLQIRPDGDHVNVTFAGKTMRFLQEDVRLLPVANITVEELSHYFLSRLLEAGFAQRHQLVSLKISVSSGSKQWGASEWLAAEA